MRAESLLCLQLFVGCACGLAGAEEEKKTGIAELVGRLGAEDYETRQAAREKLIALEEEARDAVEAALRNEDPEVVSNATAVLKILNAPKLFVYVQDSAQRPLPEMPVTLRIKSHTKDTVATGQDGCAIFRNLAVTKELVSARVVRDDVHPSQANASITGLKERRNEIRMTVGYLPFVKGVLVAQDGKPAPGLEVFLLGKKLPAAKKEVLDRKRIEAASAAATAKTDAQGAFRLPNTWAKAAGKLQMRIVALHGENLVFESNEFAPDVAELNGELDLGKLQTQLKEAPPPPKTDAPATATR